MKLKLILATALLLLTILLTASNWQHPDGAADFPVRNGHFYIQEGNSAGQGFRLTDDVGVPFWSRFEELGGVAVLGRPISRRFLCGVDLCQATENAILRWHNEAGQGALTTEEVSQDAPVPGLADGQRPLAEEGLLARQRGLIPPAALVPESAAAAALPDLPALSKRAEDVGSAVRPAVVKIEVGADEYGSGVIFDRRGYVLTNQHVVADADRITVALPDGRRLPGTVVGGDAEADVAVVKVSATNLPVAPLGDSSAVKSGDEVVVIGYAPMLGSTPSARTGVVRFAGAIPGHSFLPDVIQSDAFVHPGDSGGPLLNLRGEVIGLTEAMVSSRQHPGSLLAHALASNGVKATIADIVQPQPAR